MTTQDTNTPTTTDTTPLFSGNTITVELSFDARGELVVRLPIQPNLIGGNVTIIRGTVEQTLREILGVEQKIARRAAKFYGEPTASQLARDIRRANTDTNAGVNAPRSAVAAMDLEF